MREDEMSKQTTALARPPDELPLTEPETDTPAVVSMFERLAKDPQVDVEKLERLIGMQERIMLLQSKAAFDAAFAELQADLPTIAERAKTNNGRYAPLEDIVEAIRPVLRAHGFALSHRTEWPDNHLVKVIGVLSHRQGHSRESEFLSAADVSGNKNAVQALGSTVSYGRRYTTKDLLNIVTRGEDDDARRSGNAALPPQPDGYTAFVIGLEAAAEKGLDALKAEWAKGSKALRDYHVATDREGWEALKKEAGAVK
jgi:hypothetical protein